MDNLRLNLSVSLSGKSRLHGKSKASEIGRALLNKQAEYTAECQAKS